MNNGRKREKEEDPAEITTASFSFFLPFVLRVDVTCYSRLLAMENPSRATRNKALFKKYFKISRVVIASAFFDDLLYS